MGLWGEPLSSLPGVESGGLPFLQGILLGLQASPLTWSGPQKQRPSSSTTSRVGGWLCLGRWTSGFWKVGLGVCAQVPGTSGKIRGSGRVGLPS